KDAWAFNANAFDVGYRDQRYTAALEQYGKVKAAFDYNQIPLWYGDAGETPYTETSPGVFRLNDTIQSLVQSGKANITAYAPDLHSIDIRSRRDTTNGSVTYSPTRNLDLSFVMNSTSRTGDQPWSGPFGFSNTTVLAVPLDRRNNDVTTAAEWSNQRGMVRLAWDGSWFTNNVSSLVWDNPLRYTDTTNANAYSSGAGTSQGQMSLWPDSTAQTVSASGSIKLPMRARAFAYLSLGDWKQNDQLLPFTINSAIPPIPLPRDTAEMDARVTAMNYRYTARPTNRTWFSAQYRLYDWDNRSEPFPLTTIVRLDETAAASPEAENPLFGYKRQFADVDASYDLTRFVSAHGGYGVERDHRTYRYVETTTDHDVRASLDSTGLSWGSVRVQYDRSIRTGAGLDEQVLDDIGEQESLRQFDIANRTRDRVSAILQYVPTETVGFNATTSLARERRPDSVFGLQDNDVHAVTLGVDYTPAKYVSGSLSYSFENYGTLQRSRQANPPPDPQFTDPRRDWTTDMNENVHTVSASLDFPEIVRKTALRLGYDTVHDDAQYVYGLAPNSTLPPVVQLPNVTNHFGTFTADARYTISKKVGVGAGYRLDHFDTNDFALTPGIMDNELIPTFLGIGYQYRPYNVNTGFVRLFYAW
ncbi:MAG TPA: MtrB/PioB family outer membrane beta-barrel protein, partial [Vicinamibacterales bacterium]|nr:MtrB/PioB family outer membrane beta-barrel protein [Vicinamibacterales bacterium]